MSNHNKECSAMEILPHALVCLNHLQMVHFESDITAYFGQASAQSDIYVISGAETRRRVQEFIISLNAEKIAEKGEAGACEVNYRGICAINGLLADIAIVFMGRVVPEPKSVPTRTTEPAPSTASANQRKES
jgi:hypothetical protein